MILKKEIAIFCIFLIISMSITFSSSLKPVDAANVDTCEITNDGQYCVEAPSGTIDNCKVGYLRSTKRRTEVPNCNLGTCVPLRGLCQEDKFKIECQDNSGKWYPQEMRNVVDCQKGCCNVANAVCSIEQKKVCIYDLAGGNANAFLSGITNTEQCDLECKKEEVGCCKKEDSCVYQRRGQCSGGEFFANTYCRDVVGCMAKTHAYISRGAGIVDDDERYCYYYDDKGNREEPVRYRPDKNIIEINDYCKYPDEICKDDDGKGGENATCESTACLENNPYTTPENFRTGESLCINVHPAHFMNTGRSTALKDYKLSCQWGEVEADDLVEDRSIVCIEQVDVDGNIHAKFIENKWEECLKCGEEEALGSVTDIFAYLPPPFESTLLAVTGNKPCKGRGDDWSVWYGEECEDRGKVGDIEMCGGPSLPQEDRNDYDNDFWAPVGSCNPKYPPSGDHCGECGEGGDALVNLCTEEECNALGDCHFEPDGLLSWESIVTGGAFFTGLCLTAVGLAAFITGHPEGAAPFCAGMGENLYLGALAIAISTGYSYGAAAAARPVQYNMAKLELENGKVDITDLLRVTRTIETETDAPIDDWGILLIAQKIIENKGEIKPDWLKDVIGKIYFYSKFGASWIAKLGLNPASWVLEKVSKTYLEKEYVKLQKTLGTDLYKDGGEKGVKDAAKLLSKKELKTGIEGLKEQVEKEGAKKALLSSSNIVKGLSIIFSSAILGKSFNRGKCVPETSMVNNERCSLCGPAEGQWWCTEERCGVLGAYTINNKDARDNIGHCKWVPKEENAEYDGHCIPLEVSDATPPKIKKIDITVYDSNNNILEKETATGNTLDLTTTPLSWNAKEIKVEIKTDENAKCKYGKKATTEFDSMSPFDNELFPIIHEVTIQLTESDKVNQDLRIYLKCMDVNENKIENDNSFIKIKFDKRPDTAAPIIRYIDPWSSLVPYDRSSVTIKLLVYDEDDTEECKYSSTESKYPDMGGLLVKDGLKSCPDTIVEDDCREFTLDLDLTTGGKNLTKQELPQFNLSGLEGARLFFYGFKCKDTSGNVMETEYNWTIAIIPTFDMEVKGPRGTLYTRHPTFDVETSTGTFCKYYIEDKEFTFGKGPKTRHTKEHNESLESGQYTATIKCEDLAGNEQEDTTDFRVAKDISGPAITRVYTEDTLFYVLTAEDAICKYSTTSKRIDYEDEDLDPMMGEEEEHTAYMGDSEVFYIICRDSYGNDSPVYTIHI